MKPLKRPMFRSGGPIKEGIMSGMQDKPQQLVQPAADGSRPGYAGPLAFLAPLLGFGGGTALRVGGTRAATSFLPQAIEKAKSLFGRNVPQNVGTTTIGGKTVQTAGSGKNIFQPNLAGRIILQDPTVRTGTAIVKAVTSPAVKGPVASVARLVFSPTGVATGLYYANGKFFNKDTNEEVPPPDGEVVLGDEIGTSGAPGGGDPDMMGDGSFFAKQAAEAAKKAKSEENEALRQKYYKIMGLDKMKKDAVYDSLIDASRIVSEEGGDLKGSLKSGTLQNKIIQAISGQLDKSAALKKQIDAAILKGEIEKDIKASDPKAAKQSQLLEKQIAIADKTLAGDTLQETVNKVYEKTGAFPSGTSLAAVARTKGIEITSTADTTELTNYKNDNKGKNEIDFLKEIVAKGGATDGNYVVGNRILVVKDGKVIPYL